MNQKWKTLWALALALMCVFGLCVTAYAHDVPDLSRLGSITITTRKGETVISGGTLTIYQVGAVVENDGNYSFQPTGDFVSCGESFENLENTADMAVRLAEIASRVRGIATKQIGQDGAVKFENLPVGLYLIVQHQAAPGYAKLTPFLVSLPYMKDGKYEYDLFANPKSDLEREPEPTPPPATKPDPVLPQTGQLWWPVPLLAVAGMACFAIGWVLSARKGKRNEE